MWYNSSPVSTSCCPQIFAKAKVLKSVPLPHPPPPTSIVKISSFECITIIIIK